MSDLGIIQDGALLLSRGVIEHVGTTRRLENLAQAKKASVIDATGMTILPGFIDPDCHLFPSCNKKAETVALHELSQIIHSGTLAMDSVAGPHEDETAEIKELRMNQHLRAKYPNLISTYAAAKPEDMELRKLVRQEALQFVEFRAEQQVWTSKLAQHWRERAAEMGFLMKGRAESLRHCADFPVEQICFDGDANEEEIRWASGQDWLISGSPIRDLRRGRRSRQWRSMVEAGVALAISTGAISNGAISGGHETGGGQASMQLMIALACTEMGLTVAEAITAATINAAHALGIQRIAGSLEPGKRADLLILDVPDHHEISYHLGINLVSKVILHGKIICEQTELAWPGA